MSEKRSWDIQPKQKAPPPRPTPQAPRPAPVARPTRIETRRAPKPEPVKKTVVKAPRREKIPQGREREPLKERRRRQRRRSTIITLVLLVVIIVGIFICLWLPAFRVQHVDAAGPDSQGSQVAALSALTGRDYYVFPRDSIFFFPEEVIRANILQDYPDLSAVAISRTSFDSIALATVPRTQSFIWCGTSYPTDQPVVQSDASSTTPLPVVPASTCYSVDGQGVLFAAVPADAASSTDTLIAYAPINPPSAGTSSTASPLLGSSISQASEIPTTLEFIKVMKSLNAAIVSFAIRDDEVDLYTQGNTRITYVLGREAEAKVLAESAFSSLNLNDGSLEYVDLRFDGKVYFKKVGTDAQSTSQ